MRVETIRLENFRQYYGQEEAQFSKSDDLNVTVLYGLNGAGKTSLFSAINWCLYGAGVEDIGELVNKRALMEAREGEPLGCRVMVWFIHEAQRYVASKFLRVRKSGQTGIPVGSEFRLTRVLASGDNQRISNPEGQMNAILPANVRPYFFFDGEKMDDLTRAGNKEVQEAVRNVMRIPALERAETHLKQVAADYRKQIRKQGSQEVDRMVESEEELRAERDQKSRRLEELKDEVSLARRHIDELDQKLRGSEATRVLQENRDNNLRVLKRLEDQERTALGHIQTAANKSYVLLVVEKARTALTLLDEKRERGEIPSGIREQFVEDLLHNLQCICERPFRQGDEVYTRLSSLLSHATSSKLESEVLGLAGNLRALPGRIAEQRSNLDERIREREDTKGTVDQLYRELDEIERQLRNDPEEEIAGLERQRSKFRRNLDMALSEQGSHKTRIEDIDREIKDVVRKRREAEEKEKKLTLLLRKEKLAQTAADAVTQIKEQFSEQTREEIEAATREVFSKLAWKQEHFHDVRLDQDFRLEVIDRWETPTRKELSAGERQVLSLSFICAMARVSGEDAPLIMDTPFGRLSGDHLSAIAENLPGLTSQLILFVTDREWRDSRAELQTRVGAQYELNFDSATGCTEIKELAYL